MAQGDGAAADASGSIQQAPAGSRTGLVLATVLAQFQLRIPTCEVRIFTFHILYNFRVVTSPSIIQAQPIRCLPRRPVLAQAMADAKGRHRRQQQHQAGPAAGIRWLLRGINTTGGWAEGSK